MTGLPLAEFAATQWSRAPLLRRAIGDDRFAELLSLPAVDEIVSRRGLRTPFVRMSKDGELLPAGRYTRGGGAGAEIADQVADDKVLAEFGDGATLVLQAMHRMWPPIQAFAVELSTQLGHPVQVNAYITPPQNRGFAPHYDVHDVFVLQFAGSKHWKIHAPVHEAPLREQPWTDRKSAVAARAAETPLVDTVLEPGDVLYLPRGYIHSAVSLGDVSGHLTIGVHPMTRRAIVDRIVAALGDDIELRRSLPAGVDLADAAALDGEIDAAIAALHAAVDRVDRTAIARGIGRQLGTSTRPAPLNPLEQLAAAAALSPATPVRLRPGLRAVVKNDGKGTMIVLPDKKIKLTTANETAARAALTGACVTAESLPGIDSGDGLALLAQLLRDGVVVPA